MNRLRGGPSSVDPRLRWSTFGRVRAAGRRVGAGLVWLYEGVNLLLAAVAYLIAVAFLVAIIGGPV
ncbi:MAG: hypothetical protein M3P40_00370 [Actinomycetota bacterium]|nr:hypothetical protein [Actinomycetota bacterium]